MIFFKWMAPEGQTLQNLVLLSTLERLIQLTAALVRLFGSFENVSKNQFVKCSEKVKKYAQLTPSKGFFPLYPTFLLNSPAVGL